MLLLTLQTTKPQTSSYVLGIFDTALTIGTASTPNLTSYLTARQVTLTNVLSVSKYNSLWFKSPEF